MLLVVAMMVKLVILVLVVLEFVVPVLFVVFGMCAVVVVAAVVMMWVSVVVGVYIFGCGELMVLVKKDCWCGGDGRVGEGVGGKGVFNWWRRIHSRSCRFHRYHFCCER